MSDAILSSGVRFHSVEYAPFDSHARHCHAETTVTLILSGSLEESWRSGSTISGAFSAVVKPAGVYHADRYGPRGTHTFQMVLEARDARAFCPSIEYGWHRGGPIARSLLTAFRLAREGSLHDRSRRDDCAVDVLSAIGRDRAKHRTARSNRLADLARYLDAAPDSVSIRELADEMRMHPVSLARAFRRHYGCSITEYLRRRRIVAACELIDAGVGALADVAADAGFTDQPHLTRMFRRETGLTPAAYRDAIHVRGGSNRSRHAPCRRVV